MAVSSHHSPAPDPPESVSAAQQPASSGPAQPLNKKQRGLFIALFACSVPQCILFVFSIGVSVLVLGFFNYHAIDEMDAWWCYTAAVHGVTALAVTLGAGSVLGIYSGMVWVKRRHNRDGIEPVVCCKRCLFHPLCVLVSACCVCVHYCRIYVYDASAVLS